MPLNPAVATPNLLRAGALASIAACCLATLCLAVAPPVFADSPWSDVAAPRPLPDEQKQLDKLRSALAPVMSAEPSAEDAKSLREAVAAVGAQNDDRFNAAKANISDPIARKLADWIIDSRIGALDRTLGFLYGAARGILVVAVALMFFNWLAGERAPEWIAQAKSRPLLESIGAKIESLLPEDPENSILKRLKPDGAAPQPEAGTPPAPSTEPPAAGEESGTPAPDESEDAPAPAN